MDAAVVHSPIASLDPDNRLLHRSQPIRAVCSLIWPYSSSTGTVSLLCSDPDFRLRRNGGQVRVQFQGPAAKAVATSGVSIGDTLRLDLEGATWIKAQSPIRIPGKSVQGDLVFSSRLHLDVFRDDAPLVKLDFNVLGSPSPSEASPRLLDADQSSATGPAEQTLTDQWSSPAFLRSHEAPEASLFSQDFDPFTDENEHGLGGPRKRVRFERPSGQWRYAENGAATLQQSQSEPSQGALAQRTRPQTPSGAYLDSDTPAVQSEHTTPGPARATQPPTLPPVTTDMSSLTAPNQTQPPTPLSPHLTPLKSPDLPLISPFPSQSAIGSDSIFWGIQNQSFDFLSGANLGSPLEGRGLATNNAGITLGLDGSVASVETLNPPSAGDGNISQFIDFEGLQNNDEISSQYGSAPEKAIRPDAVANGISQNGPKVSETTVPKDVAATLSAQSSQAHSRNTAEASPSMENSSSRAEEVSRENRRSESTDHDTTIPRSFPFSSPSISQSSEVAVSQVEQSLFGFTSPRTPQAKDIKAYKSASFQEGRNDQDVLDASDRYPSQPTLYTSPVLQSRYHDSTTPQMSQERESLELSSPTMHRVDQILERGLPVTPAASHSNLEQFLASGVDSRAAAGTNNDQDSRSKPIAAPMAPKAVDVPDVISPWFASKSSNHQEHPVIHQHREIKGTLEKSCDVFIHEHHHRPVRTSKADGAIQTPREPQTQDSPSENSSEQRPASIRKTTAETLGEASGLRTSLSYYVPLSVLDKYQSTPSSLESTTVDILGVVTSPTSKPRKAKSGPRDFNVVSHVSDPYFHPRVTQIQCFRPYSRSLPSADVGDVILLRSFVVKSRKRQCFLLSAAASAWYVWRFSTRRDEAETDTSSTPFRARDNKDKKLSAGIEECAGPPVEVGVEERKHAQSLREWWVARQERVLDAKASL